MKIELSTYEAADILLKDEYANWTRGAALALVEYFEALEEDLGESMDLDLVAIRCEWTEFESIFEAAQSYSLDEMSKDEALEYFMSQTTVIPFEGGVLIQQF